MAMVSRFDIYLVSLDPTTGSEIKKTRPCLVASSDEINAHPRAVMVAPMTIVPGDYPFRLTCSFQSKKGQIALDQLTAIDKTRLIRKPGGMPKDVARQLLARLQDMFAGCTGAASRLPPAKSAPDFMGA